MEHDFAVTAGLHWGAVLLYVTATVLNVAGLIFGKEKAEQLSYRLVWGGILIHGSALIYWWRIVGHGPYMTRQEVFSSNAWVMLVVFLVFRWAFPRIKAASVVVFPSAFLLVALSLFVTPLARKLPPTLRSIWLVLHVVFYKIALGAIIIAVAFSLFYVLRQRTRLDWLRSLPETDTMDLLAYRFAGFGFTFWAIGMLSGSIWAYQSWGRFWAWDPVETWSLITWIAFGIYLHLRRFFGWKGERAAYFFITCFLISIIAIYFTPLINSSIHSQYFR